MSGEFVEADFDLEIKGENQVLIVQISLLKIFLHDEIMDYYLKKQEIKIVEKRLKKISENLAQYIANSEKKFIGYFNNIKNSNE